MKRTMVYFLIIFWMCSIASSTSLESEGAYNSITECKETDISKCPNNDVLFSTNRMFYTYIRQDGCLVVIKKADKKKVWSSCRRGQKKNEGCSPRTLTLQLNGQATIEDCKKKILWKTSVRRPGKSPYKLRLTRRGRLIIEDSVRTRIWPSRMRKRLFIDEGSATFPLAQYMLNGNGVRTQTVQMKFKKPFKEVPHVSIALRYIDIIQKFNNRINVSVEAVTKEGFTAKLTTWADTSVWSVTASWIAHKRSVSKSRKSVIIDGGVAGMPQNAGWMANGQHGNMVNGPGEQSAWVTIKFNKKFNEVPRVSLALTLWDFDRGVNQRIQINPHEITKEGFKLQFYKWADTKLYGAGASWFAFSKETTPRFQKPKSPKIQSGFAGMPQKDYMMNGNGERHVVVPVKFPKSFRAPPMVLARLKTVDQGNAANQRINIIAKDIKNDGFNIDIVTWADTKIYGTEVSWIAVAQVK